MRHMSLSSKLKLSRFFTCVILGEEGMCWRLQLLEHFMLPINCRENKSVKQLFLWPCFFSFFEGISSSMNFDEEEDDDDEISSSSSQLNSNTRPGSATSKKSCKVKWSSQHTLDHSAKGFFLSCLCAWMTRRKKRLHFYVILFLALYFIVMTRLSSTDLDHWGLMWHTQDSVIWSVNK